jgi:hypothetical protein
LSGDTDSDGQVDVQDVQLTAERWNSLAGTPGSIYDPVFDLDHDQDIDMVDIQIVASQWGQSCLVTD